jgi:hypothetical protein
MIKMRRRNKIGLLILGAFVFAGFMKFLGSDWVGRKSALASRGPSSISKPLSAQAQEFHNELQALLRSFPTQSQNLKVLITPESLVEAADRLGEVAEKTEANPEFRPLALDFYGHCAVQKDGVSSIQAVCLKKARELYQEMKDENPAEAIAAAASLDLQLSPDVEKLAW